LKSNKSQKLLRWCKQKEVFSSVDIRMWGLENHYISADRVVRKFAEDGLVNRLSNSKIKELNLVKLGNAKIAWYEPIRKEIQQTLFGDN
jgi:hypothetical protein